MKLQMVGFNLFLEGQNKLDRLGEKDFKGRVAILAMRLTKSLICGRFLLSPKVVLGEPFVTSRFRNMYT
jgi:hypothetical protein